MFRFKVNNLKFPKKSCTLNKLIMFKIRFVDQINSSKHLFTSASIDLVNLIRQLDVLQIHSLMTQSR
jgi:hypothetical protein